MYESFALLYANSDSNIFLDLLWLCHSDHLCCASGVNEAPVTPTQPALLDVSEYKMIPSAAAKTKLSKEWEWEM